MTDSPDTKRYPLRSPHVTGRRGFVWLMGLLAAVFVAATVYQLDRTAEQKKKQVGDGEHVETYRFTLEPLLVDRELLAAAGVPKNAVPTLDSPDTLTAKKVAERRESWVGRFDKVVVGGERVAGVVVSGEARAYPLRMVKGHAIVNDRVGGRPIAVTYSAPSGSLVVLGRRCAGETLTFGHSGLVYNANLLLYDRREERAKESLWAQLQFRAVAGPAAAKERTLDVLPVTVTTWDKWRRRHPETTVIRGEPEHDDRYREKAYEAYYERGRPQYPVEPLPDREKGPGWMERVTAYRGSDGWRVRPVRLHEASSLPTDAPVVEACWFAWHAMHGGEGLVRSD